MVQINQIKPEKLGSQIELEKENALLKIKVEQMECLYQTDIEELKLKNKNLFTELEDTKHELRQKKTKNIELMYMSANRDGR